MTFHPVSQNPSGDDVIDPVPSLHLRLLTANSSEARQAWREARQSGVTEDLKRWLAMGSRTAPHGLSDEC